MDDFRKYADREIRKYYSSAGAVQKIMRKKKWYLPLYQRIGVPFEGPKIIVNSKNMKNFTYSELPHYSSGGGLGGQNFIFFKSKPDSSYSDEILTHTDLKEFTKFTNAVLNSTYLQDIIRGGKYNQLSTAKIQQLPFPRIDFSSAKEKALYLDIIGKINEVLKITRSPKRQMSPDTEKMIQNVEVQINMLVLDLWRLINSN
jgi:hypothetical protein